MSDVFCAFYLMGPVVAGIVEGCPSEGVWLDSILSVDMRANGPSNNVNTTYQAWVYLFSTLIRLAPLSLERRLVLDRNISDRDSYLHVFCLPFCGQEFLKRHYQVRQNLYHRAPICMRTVHDSEIVDPIFDRRDIRPFMPLDHRSFMPLELCRIMFELAKNITMRDLTTSSAIKFLLNTNEEAKKVRPMTVSPPVVTFDCRPLFRGIVPDGR
jgi:hypothetical protein